MIKSNEKPKKVTSTHRLVPQVVSLRLRTYKL